MESDGAIARENAGKLLKEWGTECGELEAPVVTVAEKNPSAILEHIESSMQ